jgi:SAM-dependent methyltransferase
MKAMSYKAVLNEFYANRDREDQYERCYGYVNPVAAAYWYLRDEIVFETIQKHFDTLRNPLRVLEIGVGHGHELEKFSLIGIPNSGLVGIDLVFERLDDAKYFHPCINVSQQDGAELAFADCSFDIVCQFTCVMHALSKELQSSICREMARVLKPGGIIIWWDVAPQRWRNIVFRRFSNLIRKKISSRQLFYMVRDTLSEVLVYSARRNILAESSPNYQLPISQLDVIQMFPGLKVQAKYFGLDYYIWENIWRRNRILAQTLWRSGWLWQHCFAIIEKQSI